MRDSASIPTESWERSERVLRCAWGRKEKKGLIRLTEGRGNGRESPKIIIYSKKGEIGEQQMEK